MSRIDLHEVGKIYGYTLYIDLGEVQDALMDKPVKAALISTVMSNITRDIKRKTPEEELKTFTEEK